MIIMRGGVFAVVVLGFAAVTVDDEEGAAAAADEAGTYVLGGTNEEMGGNLMGDRSLRTAVI